MPRLKDRNRFIPNGYVFYQPQTGWKAPRFASFDTIVNALIAHRKGNAFLCQKHGWSTDRESVANEVDEFNAAVCLKMGWNDYVSLQAVGGQPAALPFQRPTPSLSARLGKLAAGGLTLVEWIKSGAEAVPAPLAAERAAVCAKCPLNEKGDWTSFFTIPVSEAIREAVRQRKDWNLTTPHDPDLFVCSACYCPLPLMIHVPLDFKLKKMDQQTIDALHSDCWIRKEKEHVG